MRFFRNDLGNEFFEINENVYIVKYRRDGRRTINGISAYRFIVEKKIGRKLLPDECVHHIDGNHSNDDPNNLMVMSQLEHNRLHKLGKTPKLTEEAKLLKSKRLSQSLRKSEKFKEYRNSINWEERNRKHKETLEKKRSEVLTNVGN